MVKLKGLNEMFTEAQIKTILGESSSDMNAEIDFESFLRVSFWGCYLRGFIILFILFCS